MQFCLVRQTLRSHCVYACRLVLFSTHRGSSPSKGNGPTARTDDISNSLNTTTYPQPRRVQWASPSVPERTDTDGERVVGLMCYPHYYTKSPLLRRCEAMPSAIEELITFAIQCCASLLDRTTAPLLVLR